MHVKIQGGGGGTYANTGSCSKVAKYLEHEDEKNKERGQDVEPFFNHRQESVKSSDVINSIDKNKAKLCQDESKFLSLPFLQVLKNSKEWGTLQQNNRQR